MFKKINRIYVILVGILVVILCSYIKNIRDSPKESTQNGSNRVSSISGEESPIQQPPVN